jgi:hypothetical protein
LPKDSWLLAYGLESYALSPGSGYHGLRLIPMAREINDGMPAHMLNLITAALRESGRELAGSKVVILGVAYLENADDTRNTPAAALARLLAGQGAVVVAHDPFVRSADWVRALGASAPEVSLTASLWLAIQDADALVLVTRHSVYQELDLEQAARLTRTRVLVDGRNAFDPAAAAAAGFVLRSIGKGAAAAESQQVGEEPGREVDAQARKQRSKFMISLNSTIAASENQISSDLGGEIACLNLESGIYYGLDAVGARIWELIQVPRSVSEIRDILLEEYDVQPQRCERELLALLDQLATENLIVLQDGTHS